MNLYSKVNAMIDTYDLANERALTANKAAKALNAMFSNFQPTLMALPQWLAHKHEGNVRSLGYDTEHNVDLFIYPVSKHGEVKKVEGKITPSRFFSLKVKGVESKHDALSEPLFYDDTACYNMAGKRINFSDLEIGDVQWEDKPDPVDPASLVPWTVNGKKHTFEVAQAIEMLEQYMRDMPLNKCAKYSNGAGRKSENAYMPSLTECGAALTVMKMTGVLYLPTSFRTTIPLPFGGVGTTPDGRGFTDEDKLNMSGCDIMRLDEDLNERKKYKSDGKRIDVKHIPSVCNAFYESDNAPVELAYEDSRTGNLSLRDPLLWTWSDSKTDEYMYVLRNTVYQIPKKNLVAAAIGKEKEFLELFKPGERFLNKTFIRNKSPNGAGRYKWNIYFSPEELASMSVRVFEMDPLYAELMGQNAYDLLDEILPLYNSSDLRANLRYFYPDLSVSEKVRR